jgi:GTPase SAR1 family protein
MKESLAQLGRFSLLQDLELCSAFVDVTVFTFVCNSFRHLISLNVGNNPALLNVPPAVSLLKNLTRLCVLNCESLMTFPDELLHLTRLTVIEAEGCRAITYPPKTLTDQGCKKILQYLQKALKATPLKRVKVMFLGNGRSGKTSLLRALAKKPLISPLDPGPDSTQGVSVDPLEDLLVPSKLDKLTKWGGLPDISFWDFAGQLEYSAAHTFFMSHKQAVYVIVFSAVEERESRMNQVAYWLRTVVANGVSEHVRFLLIGTKVDLIEEDWNSVKEKLRSIEAEMRSVVRSCCDSSVSDQNRYQILFVTSVGTYPHYKSMRRDVKGSIFLSCQKIFEGRNLSMLRFPDEYKQVLDSIHKLKWESWEPPLLKLEDLTDPKLYGEHLVNSHSNPAKIEALRVLHDVGAIIFCMIQEHGRDHPWICLKPQIIADIIAIFADPQSDLPSDRRACASRQQLEDILVEKYFRSEKYLKKLPDALQIPSRADKILKDAAQKLFGFLLAIHIFSPTEVSEVSLAENSPSSASFLPQFIVPSALKGRPSFWREVFDSSAFSPENSRLWGFRFSCKNQMVTVAAFVMVMSSLCTDRKHMWGCAFSFVVKDAHRIVARIFVRLAEGRDFVDMLVVGSDVSLREQCVQDSLSSIASRLNCSHDFADRLYLCPYCCSSDMFVRSGAAHAFRKQQVDALDSASYRHIHHNITSSAASEPTVQLLSCSRYHEVAKDTLLNGLFVEALGGHGMSALYPQVPSARDSLKWKRVSHYGMIELEGEFKQFKVMPNSFFELTLQLKEGEIVTQACKQTIDDAIRSNATTCHFEPPMLRRDCDSPIANLKLEYTVGSEHGTGASKKVIAAILSCSETSEIESLDGNIVTTKCVHRLVSGSRVMLSVLGTVCIVTDVFSDRKLKLHPEDAEPASKVASVSESGDITTACDHSLQEGAKVILSVPEDNGGKVQGVICKVASVKSKKILTLRREPPSDVKLPLDRACGASIEPILQLVPGTTIFPLLERFSFRDNVLVLYIPQVFFPCNQPELDAHARVHPTSFFALTKQLKAYEDHKLQIYDKIVNPPSEKLQKVIESSPQEVHVQIQECDPSAQPSGPCKVRDTILKLRYKVGDFIDSKPIEYISAISQKVEVASVSESGDITTACDHSLQEGAKVILSVPGKVQGVICKVASVKSKKILTLRREPPSDVKLPLDRACGASIEPMLESFSVLDQVSVVLKQRPPFTVFPGVSNEVDILQLRPGDCNRSDEAACWRDVEDNWAIMLGHEFQNYEITGMTLFRCEERERLFLKEVEHLEMIAPLRPAQPDFSCAKLDSSEKQSQQREELQQQVMGHFGDFSQKFSLLPAADNKDVNVCVAWWGKWPAVYHGAAQNGFWNLPTHLKIDPGYFGEGFYLTRYPRYSDYYINGFRCCRSCNL